MKKEALYLYCCPSCRKPLEFQGESEATEIRTGLLMCRSEGLVFSVTKGIPHLILPGRKAQADQLCQEIALVRQAQGLAIDDWGYYQRLPYPGEIRDGDNTGIGTSQVPAPLTRMWRERAAAFEKLYSMIRFEQATTILDLGAGCGWLSNRLANRFNTIAIDIDAGPYGLMMAEAFLKSGKHFERCRGEIANIPLATGSVDIAIMAASAEHEDLPLMAAEMARVLKPHGIIYIMDTPMFTTTAGQMRATARLENYYGILSTPLLAKRHQPILISALAEELKGRFTVEIFPAERPAKAFSRSLREIFNREELPTYPIVKAKKLT